MQKVHLITAILVALLIYGVVMERDAMVAFAQNTTQTGADAIDDNATEPETSNEYIEVAVSVVAFHSVAAEVQSGIILRGRTEAARRVDVRSEGSGRVISQPIRKGERVLSNQVLCQLDPGTLGAQFIEAHARQTEAAAGANTASQLAERGFGPENNAIAAQAALESAKANVQRVELMMEQLVIRAPFSGLLETDTAEIGSLLQPGGLCGTVISLESIKLVGFVPELDVLELRVGTLAGARLLSGREVVGRVTFISRSADPLTRTFRLEVTVPNPGLEIRDGLTAEIGISTDGMRGHLLPQHVLTLDDEGTLGVRIARDGVARFIPVSIIRDAPDGFWLAGLPEQADVIVVGQEYVIDGRAISVTMQGAE